MCAYVCIGECKEQMKLYLSCLQKNGATSSPCRLAGKEYLECRMTKYVPPHLSFILMHLLVSVLSNVLFPSV